MIGDVREKCRVSDRDSLSRLILIISRRRDFYVGCRSSKVAVKGDIFRIFNSSATGDCKLEGLGFRVIGEDVIGSLNVALGRHARARVGVICFVVTNCQTGSCLKTARARRSSQGSVAILHTGQSICYGSVFIRCKSNRRAFIKFREQFRVNRDFILIGSADSNQTCYLCCREIGFKGGLIIDTQREGAVVHVVIGQRVASVVITAGRSRICYRCASNGVNGFR